ncbi:MAG: DUF4339 domain-containing protein [Planctomycetes bacterium]|nr:DUF4339 domain-containing protein [Planctomycetota bacterium]
MAAQWYYTSSRQQMGPVTWAELSHLADSGFLRPTDLVWGEGMSDWSRADLQGLFHEKSAKPTPVPTAKSAEPRRATAGEDEERPERLGRRTARSLEDEEGDFGDDRPRRRRRTEGMPTGLKVGLIVGGVVMLLLVVGIVLFYVLRGSGPVYDVPNQGTLSFNNETLRSTDQRDRKFRKPCKIYNVRFEANSTYVIEHRSAAFDAFLRLEDPNGFLVAEDDDGGQNFGLGRFDARIAFRANVTGTYRVIATTFDGRTGRYSLNIRKQ